jgi:hypothetical protein
MVLMGALTGVAIALLIRSDLTFALVGLGVGAVLGVFADRWTAFVKHL